MDYDKLIERLKNAAGGPEGIQMCQDAATAIEALQADLTRVTAERDAAVEDIKDVLTKLELIRRGIGFYIDYDSEQYYRLASLCSDYCRGNNRDKCYKYSKDGGCANFEWRAHG